MLHYPPDRQMMVMLAEVSMISRQDRQFRSFVKSPERQILKR